MYQNKTAFIFLQRYFQCVIIALIFTGNAYSQNQKKCEEYSENSIDKVNSCFVAGSYSKAEETSKIVLQKNQNNLRANALLAFSLTKQNKHEESLIFYDRAIKLGGKTFDIYAYYAFSLDALDKLDESILYNKKALQLYPNLYDVSKLLSQQFEKKNNFDDAIKILQNFDNIRSSKGQPTIFSNKINSLALTRDKSIVDMANSQAIQNNIMVNNNVDDEKRFLDSCEKLITKNKISVAVNANYFIDKNKSLADVTMIQGGNGSTSFGLTQLKTKVNLKSSYVNQRITSNLWCGRVHLDIIIGSNEFIVFIASEYREGTCEYKKILEHEMMHVSYYVKALNEAREDVEKKTE